MSDTDDRFEITAGNVVTSLAMAMQKCPCRRPVISSQIMGSCERCEVEQAAAEEILRLRDELVDLR